MEASHFMTHVIGASAAFAAAAYCLTGSFGQTVLCAVLTQVGYFLAMLYLMWRTERSSTTGSRPDTQEAKRHLSASSDDLSVKAD
ncbi:exopolysaccharide production repressor protein [Mesorhizobium sp. 128a]